MFQKRAMFNGQILIFIRPLFTTWGRNIFSLKMFDLILAKWCSHMVFVTTYIHYAYSSIET